MILYRYSNAGESRAQRLMTSILAATPLMAGAFVFERMGSTAFAALIGMGALSGWWLFTRPGRTIEVRTERIVLTAGGTTRVISWADVVDAASNASSPEIELLSGERVPLRRWVPPHEARALMSALGRGVREAQEA